MSSDPEDEDSSRRRVILLEAYNAAKEGAFDLYVYSSSTFPEEWQQELPDIVRKRAIEFALHARRAHEISGVPYDAISEIKDFCIKMSGVETLQIEKNYGRTLNMIIHSHFLLLHTVQHGPAIPKIFQASKSEMHLAFMSVETDRKSRRQLNLYGLATKFLVEVAPKIKREIDRRIEADCTTPLQSTRTAM